MPSHDINYDWIEEPEGWKVFEENVSPQAADVDGPPSLDTLFTAPATTTTFSYSIEVINKTIEVEGFKLNSEETAKSTGVTLWQAAPLLSTYLCQHRQELVENRELIELGAGLGLCGIVASYLGARRSVVTDGDANAWHQLVRNVAMHSQGDNNRLQCRRVQWHALQDPNTRPLLGTFDVVLAADVIYVTSSVPLLFDTARQMLRKEGDGRFILSWINRWNNVPENLVLQAAQDHGFVVTRPQEGIYDMRLIK